ncbi:hypothetical protein Ssi03_66000 [Sphaerisporangium siamense]|uniref:Uncharacterized protein n=1 Tax=Sphaerisporangium siamense TaxID=795645 RepID=A0A7W7DFN2_9ACTN|nr:hypothetical protein [Sphaerisporangium siamense]MBB4706035.1 hypothetical protein [Sphaerisporangium siamense]GII88610.1 hypothetical protein Ssi03_66000 [Sphaerisporangium siamense]
MSSITAHPNSGLVSRISTAVVSAAVALGIAAAGYTALNSGTTWDSRAHVAALGTTWDTPPADDDGTTWDVTPAGTTWDSAPAHGSGTTWDSAPARTNGTTWD